MTETIKVLGRRNLLSISGGKDSTAMWLLAIERGVPFTAVFADTGHEHAATYEYLDYLEARLGPIRRVRARFDAALAQKSEFIKVSWPKHGVPQAQIDEAVEALRPTGIPFLDLCLLKGRFPGTMSRFCSQELKRKVIDLDVYGPLTAAGYYVVSWQGIRWDESAARGALSEREKLSDMVEAYRPLLDWTAEDVFAMHRKHGVDPNPLYLQGMTRVGCMPCIHATKGELVEISRRFPAEIDRVEAWERRVSKTARRGSATFFMTETEGGDCDSEGVRNHVDRARTTRGGKVYNLQAIEAPAACQSAFGLCE